ncbi:hypothetical protein AB0907_31025 [Streptomyces sp. NPDC006975]|uniref:hypothetical protein n=1 Tax=unclassified Streptomyces TaxID=2593676 RepID=UPI00345546FD
MKTTRRIALVGASAMLAGGAVLAGSGSATAATPPAPDPCAAAGATAGQAPSTGAPAGQAPSTGAPAGQAPSTGGHRAARQPTDPWIEDQLATFCPSSTHRLAVFDPWVKDQLAQFEQGAR